VSKLHAAEAAEQIEKETEQLIHPQLLGGPLFSLPNMTLLLCRGFATVFF
jgi:hypothetical protein